MAINCDGKPAGKADFLGWGEVGIEILVVDILNLKCQVDIQGEMASRQLLGEAGA